MSAGIDYGFGRTNIDPETGIRYGVIPQDAVLQAWDDSSEPHYGDPACPECGCGELEQIDDDWRCTRCEHVASNDDVYPESPLSWALDDGRYQATQSGVDTDIFVTRAPYYTHARFCSPCAPGAGYLASPDSDGPRTYCFGHEWFDGGEAPYPVYSVENGQEVLP